MQGANGAGGHRPLTRCAAAVLCLVLGAGGGVAVAGTHPADGARHAAAGAWGNAEEVPGTAKLNQGGFAETFSVSCSSAGTCGAGGYYQTSTIEQAFVVSEKDGAWGTAEAPPGMAKINTGGAIIYAVSCASAGNCGAGGITVGKNNRTQAFVVDEVNGAWRTARFVPGSRALNQGGKAGISTMSCASPGNCTAGGWYTDSSGGNQALVATEQDGIWGAAQEVPGSGALNHEGVAIVNSVSCASPGNCSAGGNYGNLLRSQAFVATQTRGRWGKAEEVPGTSVLNQGGGAQVTSVSCASAGNCGAGGYYSAATRHAQAFIVNEKNGTWGTAVAVPGIAQLNQGGYAQISSVSCPSAGDCGAGGLYLDSLSHGQAFVVDETGGKWGMAEEIPGTARLNTGGAADLSAVSCVSAGNCSAGGSYGNNPANPYNTETFVVGETNGTWGPAEEVPGSGKLNGGDQALIFAVSCGAVRNCSAAGFYTDSSFYGQAFVVSQH